MGKRILKHKRLALDIEVPGRRTIFGVTRLLYVTDRVRAPPGLQPDG